MKKYRTETEDIALGLEMAQVEFEPFEARIIFFISAGNYPQVDACIELRDGLNRHWMGEHDSSPICRGNGKYQAISSLKKWVKRRHPSVQTIKCDYSEIRGYYPTYTLEYKKYRRGWYSPLYEWIGTWLPL